MADALARFCYLPVADLWALRRAAEPIYEAYDQRPYLVGSCLTRRDWRDVDVRLPVPDERYEWRYLTDEDEGPAMWTLDCVSISAMLRARHRPADRLPTAGTVDLPCP